MPDDAPETKTAAVKAYGAEVVTYDRFAMPQWQAGEQLQRERGLAFVNSHDDPLISAGAGTAVVELLDDAGPLDLLLAPVGGGGGLAGYATVIKARHPDAQVVAVEPSASGLLAASLEAGRRIDRPVPMTIADGMQLTRIGALPFDVLSGTVDAVVGVTDEEIVAAMRFLFERLKLVVEPSEAAAFAALLAGKVDAEHRRVGVILSGGNISPRRFGELVR
jgi:threonine dehydratase